MSRIIFLDCKHILRKQALLNISFMEQYGPKLYLPRIIGIGSQHNTFLLLSVVSKIGLNTWINRQYIDTDPDILCKTYA
jgi:hypothetical protein